MKVPKTFESNVSKWKNKKRKLSDCIADKLSELKASDLILDSTVQLFSTVKNLDSIKENKHDYRFREIQTFLKNEAAVVSSLQTFDTLRFKDYKIKIPIYTRDSEFKLKVSSYVNKNVSIVFAKPISETGLDQSDLQIQEIEHSLSNKIADFRTFYGPMPYLTDWKSNQHTRIIEETINGKSIYQKEVVFQESEQTSELKIPCTTRNGDRIRDADIVVSSSESLTPSQWLGVITKLERELSLNGIERYRERMIRVQLPDDCFTQYFRAKVNLTKESFFTNSIQITNRILNDVKYDYHLLITEIGYRSCLGFANSRELKKLIRKYP